MADPILDPNGAPIVSASAPAEFVDDEPPAQEPGKKLSPLESRQREQSDYQKKIDKMTSRNERLLQAIEQSNQRWEQSQRELAELRSKLEQSSKPQKPAGELDRFSVEQLEEAELKFLSSEDATERQKAYAIRREIRQREREELRNEFQGLLQGERQSQQMSMEAQRAVYEAARLLGDEEGSKFVDFQTGSLKPTREMRMADSVIASIKQKRGEAIARTPEMQAYAILLAAQAARAERAKMEKAENHQEEANLLRSRINGQIGAKGEAAPEGLDRYNAALKARDVDAAISSLPWVESSKKVRDKILEAKLRR